MRCFTIPSCLSSSTSSPREYCQTINLTCKILHLLFPNIHHIMFGGLEMSQTHQKAMAPNVTQYVFCTLSLFNYRSIIKNFHHFPLPRSSKFQSLKSQSPTFESSPKPITTSRLAEPYELLTPWLFFIPIGLDLFGKDGIRTPSDVSEEALFEDMFLHKPYHPCYRFHTPPLSHTKQT